MAEEPNDSGRKHTINLTPSQVAASALAASCSALVASYLGVAGTVIGAAVGSIVATTGAAIYGHLLRSSGKKIKTTLRAGSPEYVNAMRYGTSPTFKPQGPAPHGSTPPSFNPQSPTRLYGSTQQIYKPQSPTPPTFKPQADAASADASRPWTAQVPPEADGRRLSAYRRPMMLAGAVVTVFAVAISVGFLFGGPARQAGESYFAPPANSGSSNGPVSTQSPSGSTPTAPSTTDSQDSTSTDGSTGPTPGSSPTGPTTAPTNTVTVAPTAPGPTGPASPAGASGGAPGGATP